MYTECQNVAVFQQDELFVLSSFVLWLHAPQYFLSRTKRPFIFACTTIDLSPLSPFPSLYRGCHISRAEMEDGAERPDFTDQLPGPAGHRHVRGRGEPSPAVQVHYHFNVAYPPTSLPRHASSAYRTLQKSFAA